MWLLSLLIIVLTNLSDLILIICWLIELNFLRVLMLILSWSGWLSLLLSRWLHCFYDVYTGFDGSDKICVVCRGIIHFVSWYQQVPHWLHNLLQGVVTRITPMDNATFGFSSFAEQWNGRLDILDFVIGLKLNCWPLSGFFSRWTSVEIHPGACCLSAPGPNRLSAAGSLRRLHRCSWGQREHCCAVSLVISERSQLLRLKMLCLRYVPSGRDQSPHHWQGLFDANDQSVTFHKWER